MSKLPVRDHLLARGKQADRAARFLGHAWDKGWLPPPVLEPDALWAAAAKPLGDTASAAEAAGRTQADVADFRLRLERLLDAVRNEAALNPLGQAMAYGQLVRVIGNRLKLGELWARKPEILETELAPPLLIIGQMRSGTTRLHKLFAADPAHSHTRYCDAWHPVPTRPDWRRIKGSLDLILLETLNPWLQAIHPMASGSVEEELAWLAGALNHSLYESQWHIPTYSAFSEARDPLPVYRELVRVLKTDAAHRACAERPRVMKAPQFGEDLACLLHLFPDARVVVAERAHEDVLKSAVSLVANQMALQSDECSLANITALYEHKIALRHERREAALSHWTGPLTRIAFDALSHDWQSEITRAYAELGLVLSNTALSAIQAEMAASQAGNHREHAAQLARFATQN
ncbi:MAG: sulfotransferase [Pseudomonadota bacterium]